MAEIRFDRLQTLADWLMQPQEKLGHDAFDFDVYNAKGECGTLGCAIGECPFIWPADWKNDDDDLPALRCHEDDDFSYPYGDAAEWFELPSVPDAMGLFCPNSQSRVGLPPLGPEATKEQVAANIYAFIEKSGAAGGKDSEEPRRA